MPLSFWSSLASAEIWVDRTCVCLNFRLKAIEIPQLKAKLNQVDDTGK
jgi:hypothetical protein